MKRTTIALLLSLVTLPAGAALSLDAGAAYAQEAPRTGGVIKAAMIGEPPSLDLHMTTAVITQQITWHVYETLYTYDKSLTAVPMLAESHTVADGGRRYTITLRKGVKFHNGKEMTSADVVRLAPALGQDVHPRQALWKTVEAVEAKDPYTVVIHLKEPSGSLLYGLGSPTTAPPSTPRRSWPPRARDRSRSSSAPGRTGSSSTSPTGTSSSRASRSTPRARTRPTGLRGQADRLCGRDPVHPRPRRGGAAGRRGDGRVPLRPADQADQYDRVKGTARARAAAW